MTHTVVGVFDNHEAARNAAATLETSGIDRDAIHVTDEGTSSASTTTSGDASADTGVVSRVRHFFTDMFSDDDDRDVGTYAEAVRRGNAVVKVDVEESNLDLVRDALESAGAVNIEERAAEWRQSGWDASAGTSAASVVTPAPTPTTSTSSMATGSSDQVIPVIREELAVGKRTVASGAVRVYARAISRPVTESVDLREEHARVDRQAVDRPATAADLQAFQDRTIEVQETEERAVVEKTARVVEEVTVGTEASQRTETIHDTVRETQVEVEPVAAASSDRLADDTEFRSDYDTKYAALGGGYSDYEPAYRYGHALGSDPRYAGKNWDDIEPSARQDWESRNPQSAWEKSKDAVRHAWQRITT